MSSFNTQCPLAIWECKILLDRAYGVGGVHQDHSDDVNDSVPVPVTTVPTPVPQDLYGLIHQCSAVLHAHIRHEGVVYSQSSIHLGNSLIMFYSKGCCTSSPVPGSIKYIYRCNDRLTFAVERQSPLQEKHQDPFLIYPHFPAKLYSSVMSDSLEVVCLSWVVSHFARWAVANNCVVVLSLCWVSQIPSSLAGEASFTLL